MGAAAMALVAVRHEQVAAVSRIQRLRLEEIALVRETQREQMQLARLRSPQQIKDRIERLGLQVMSSDVYAGLMNHPTAVAMGNE